jgi:hypothetical protein
MTNEKGRAVAVMKERNTKASNPAGRVQRRHYLPVDCQGGGLWCRMVYMYLTKRSREASATTLASFIHPDQLRGRAKLRRERMHMRPLDSHSCSRSLTLDLLQSEGLANGEGGHRRAGTPLGSRQHVGREETGQGRSGIVAAVGGLLSG